jgi:NADPH:quinone reductase-like Zn-dependent oxidoreductase
MKAIVHDRYGSEPGQKVITKDDLQFLRERIESGRVTPTVDRRYELGEVADAFGYRGEGHAHAKIVVSVP